MLIRNISFLIIMISLLFIVKGNDYRLILFILLNLLIYIVLYFLYLFQLKRKKLIMNKVFFCLNN